MRSFVAMREWVSESGDRRVAKATRKNRRLRDLRASRDLDCSLFDGFPIPAGPAPGAPRPDFFDGNYWRAVDDRQSRRRAATNDCQSVSRAISDDPCTPMLFSRLLFP